MPEAVCAPFRVVAAETVPEPTWWATGSEPTRLGTHLAGWDPAAVTTFVLRMDFDADAVRRDTDLVNGEPIGLFVGWHSPETTLRDSHLVLSLSEGQNRVEATLEIPAGRVAGRIWISAFMAVTATLPRRSFTAHRMGSVLWRHARALDLEGSRGRFPTEVVDFDRKAMNPGAAWMLEWDPGELDAPVYRGLRLLVNRSHVDVVEALTTSSPTQTSQAIRDAVRWDVARTIVRGVLENDEFSMGSGYGTDTVAAWAQKLLTVFFPHRSLSTLRALDQMSLDVEVQAAVRLFRNLGRSA